MMAYGILLFDPSQIQYVEDIPKAEYLMKDWTAKDWIAFVIAGGLISWGLVMILAITIRGGSISEKGLEIFAVIATGSVAALALYFGKTGT